MRFFFNNTKTLFILIGIILCLIQVAHSAEQSTKKISLDLQNVSIQDALHIVAKLIHLNVIISPSIRGVTSLHLHNVSGLEVFDMLLISHELKKWREKISGLLGRVQS